MTTHIQIIEDIRTGFPHPTVPHLDGKPTYITIKKLHDLLKSNAASIPSTLGGGIHGHLGLVLDNTLYTTIAGVALTAPASPGAYANIPVGSTNAQIGVLTRQFNADFKQYTEYNRTDQALN